MQVLLTLVGIVVLLLVAYAASTNRSRINYRTIFGALALQAGIAAFVIFVPFGQSMLLTVAAGVSKFMEYSGEGINFLFGDLGRFKSGFIFAFHVLPVIVFFSSLMAVLYYLGIMQKVVIYLGAGVSKLLGTSKAESTAAAANIFVGNTDVFVMMRPYAGKMTQSELFAMMVGGFASVAGTVLVGYASLGIEIKWLVTAVFMSAPAGLLFAKIIYPETEQVAEIPDDIYQDQEKPVNIFEAASDGANAGLKLAAAVGVILLAFISLIAMFNGILGGLGSLVGFDNLSLQMAFGYVFAPFALLLGVPFNEALTAGSLLGEKLVLNEFVAYLSFIEIKETLSEHTQVVITIALAGFVNLGAPAAALGCLGTMLPERKKLIAQMGVRLLLAATLANLMSAALVGLFISMA